VSGFPTYVRPRQAYGVVAPSSGTAVPTTATARFGLGVTQSSTYVLPATVAAGQPWGLTVWGKTTGLNTGSNRRMVWLAAAGYFAHRVELSSASLLQATISRSSGTLVQTLISTSQGTVGSLLFCALSYDGSKVTQWTYVNGALTEATFTPTGTPDAFDRLQVSDASLPVAVEQAGVWGTALDESLIQQLLKAPVDPADRRLLASAADLTRLTSGQAYTNSGTGKFRLGIRIAARLTAGGLLSDPAGTSHVVQTAIGTGLTVGQTLATGWGVTLQILAATAGAGVTPDRYACKQI
jgi:hypothetical protein